MFQLGVHYHYSELPDLMYIPCAFHVSPMESECSSVTCIWLVEL